MPTVISDTSPLFYLAKIQLLELLQKLHGKVIIPQAVWDEALACSPRHPEVATMLKIAKNEGWLEIVAEEAMVLDERLLDLDEGEAHAIALATLIKADLLIIDESEGRKVAETLGFKVTGTAGLLLRAKLENFIPSLRVELSKLVSLGFRISPALVQKMLGDAGE